MTAAEKILQKVLVGSNLDSSEWNGIQAGLRDRAFFSSQVVKANILQAMRQMAADHASGVSASDARLQMRQFLESIGHETPEELKGTLKDLYSKARLDVIMRTNVDQARGYISYKEATTPGAYWAFPAQEFLRVESRKKPRLDWPMRWQKAGGKIYGGRMIALKDDPVWVNLSVFDNPYPPFDWGSGMGVEDIPRREAVALGLITEESLEKAVQAKEAEQSSSSFNSNLEATINAGHWSGEVARNIQERLADQVDITQDKDGNVFVQWKVPILRDMFENYTPDNPSMWKLGKATDELLACCDDVSPKYRGLLAGKGLTFDNSFVTHTIREGHWLVDSNAKNMPVMPGDIELLPSLWRAPDFIEAGGRPGSLVLCSQTLDGGILKLPVVVKGKICVPTGVYKMRRNGD